jgi:hypothetical protein
MTQKRVTKGATAMSRKLATTSLPGSPAPNAKAAPISSSSCKRATRLLHQ